MHLSSDEDASPRSTPRTSTQPSTPITQSKPREKKHFCDYPGCGKAYARPVRLAEHQRSHTNERPFVCTFDDCDKSFLRESHLQHHIKAKHEDIRNHVCDYEGCGKSFHTGQRLKLHQKIHETKREEYKCTGFAPCNQEFRKQETLDRHVKLVHLQEKPFVCEVVDTLTFGICGARFKTSTHLNTHKDREHSGNRFWCKICSPEVAEIDPRLNPDAFQTAVGFPTYVEMQQHAKTVHPPTCDQCHKVCASNRDLKAHMEIQHNSIEARRNFLCDHPGCSRGFTKKGNLDVHKKTIHAKQKEWICGSTELKPSKRLPHWDGHGACGRAFTAKANLEEHIRTQHLHLPGYVRPNRSLRAKEEDMSGSGTPMSQQSALVGLTGIGYGHDRDIACLESPCPHRFLRSYDLELHLSAAHGYSTTEAIEAITEQQALSGGQFWIGGEQAERDPADFDLAQRLDQVLNPSHEHEEMHSLEPMHY